MSDIGVFTIILINTLDDIPSVSTKTVNNSVTFKLTFINPCITATIHVPAGLSFAAMTTSVKLGSYVTKSFTNFKDSVSEAF
jgi:hypothetical protein